MEITLDQLQECSNKIFESLKKVYGKNSKVKIDKDLYWFINSEMIYNIESEPKELTIGSLSEDIEKVNSINSGKIDPIGYNLKNLISILYYIAHNESQISSSEQE